MTDLPTMVGELLGGLLGHPLVGIAAAAVGIGAVVLWIAAAWWTWRDLGARVRDPISPYLAATGVLIATPLLFPLAVLVYRLVRPARRTGEREAASVRLAAVAPGIERERCPRCAAGVEPDWRRCPACGEALTATCGACRRQVGVDWTICAWCAAELPAAADGNRNAARSGRGPDRAA